MIKRSPDDFVVEEILSPEVLALSKEAGQSGPFALYRLEKEGLATPEAAGRIARALNVPSGSIAYAGLKDKHARTIQHLTLKLEAKPDAHANLSGAGWTIQRAGFLPRSITASDIHRNRFSITVRNLSSQAAFDMEQAARLLAPAPSANGDKHGPRFVNYFGDQRFGSARHGRGFIARNLIKGDFEGALKLAIGTEARKDRMDQKVFKRTVRELWRKWPELLAKLRPCAERRPIERLVNSSGDFRAAFCALPYMLQQLSVYAYQSHLWNSIARSTVATLCAPRGQVLAAEDIFGEMLFPCAESVPPELTGLMIPLLAHNTALEEPWKVAAEEILKSEGITVSELKIPGVRRPFFGEEPRAFMVEAEEFSLGQPEKDDSANDPKRRKRRISFLLPRGCYATVLLRALGQ